MTRIDERFKILKQETQAAFIVFITAGHPDLETTRRLVLEFERCGVDIVELGVPFSDPLADGPIIQNSSQVSLKKGTTILDVLRLVKDVRQETQIPIALMSYLNPIYRLGFETFAKKAREACVDGIIVPDLLPDEAHSFTSIMKRERLNTIFFLAPTSTKNRIKEVARYATGFIYFVSVTGTTGVREELEEIEPFIKEIKKETDLPICVGFGISKREHVRKISCFADGVIVGSAVVSLISRLSKEKGLIKEVKGFVERLKEGIQKGKKGGIGTNG